MSNQIVNAQDGTLRAALQQMRWGDLLTLSSKGPVDCPCQMYYRVERSMNTYEVQGGYLPYRSGRNLTETLQLLAKVTADGVLTVLDPEEVINYHVELLRGPFRPVVSVHFPGQAPRNFKTNEEFERFLVTPGASFAAKPNAWRDAQIEARVRELLDEMQSLPTSGM